MRSVEATFLAWTFARAVLHRGYVLVSSLYFVLVAGLSGAQLILLGAAMSATLLVSDIPAGAWSDAVSRKRALVIGHGLLAAGMALTGAVTGFALLVASQVLWGLGWAFSIGADVAWLTDELDRPERIDRALIARARWDVLGGVAGMLAFGVAGWALGLATAVVASGAGMALLGLFVAARFPADTRAPAPARPGTWVDVARRGAAVARADHEILLVLAATFLVNAASIVAWLLPRRLVDLGFPSDAIVWYTGLQIVASAAGAAALVAVERRIHGVGVARRAYAWGGLAGALGLVVLVVAPDALLGGVGVVLLMGVAFNVTRAVATVWINRRTTSEVRATVHSFLSQAETVGEILGGLALAGAAAGPGIPVTLLAAAALFAAAAVTVARRR